MALSSISLQRVIKWSHLSGWLFSYSNHLKKISSHVLAYGNLCCSIGAELISLISTTHAQYLTIMALNYCNMDRSLIGCSMNYHTYPGTMSSTFTISSSHDESCSTCDLTMFQKSTKLLHVSNSGRSLSLIAWLIFVHIFYLYSPWWVLFIM
jgi:hypothetical protein